jgi:uncharacterized protein DUF4382/carboxypeptidase family protein
MRSLRFLLALLPLAALAGCSNNDNPSSPGSGTMVVRMTDAPAAVQAVNLVVNEVAVRVEEGQPDSLSGWLVINSTTHTYNLMNLQNGVFTTIGQGTVPAGTYTQMRLKLGAGSTIVVDGTTYPLTVPSGMQSGLKVDGSFLVPAGGTSDVSLDFDASRSIVQTGAGSYLLKPVIHVMSTTAAGAIRGTVQPAGVATSVYATQGADTLSSALTAANGQFMMSVLSPGTYDVRFHPALGYRDTTVANVLVTAGQTAVVDTVQLSTTVLPQ